MANTNVEVIDQVEASIVTVGNIDAIETTGLTDFRPSTVTKDKSRSSKGLTDCEDNGVVKQSKSKDDLLSLNGAEEESKHSFAISHERLDLVNNRNYRDDREKRGIGKNGVKYGRLEQYARAPSEMSQDDRDIDLENGRRLLRNHSRDAIRQYRSMT